jgi:hypothetical protein
MRPELSARLCRIMRGDPLPKSAVTPVTPVTGPSRYRSKPLELQALQPLQVKNSKLENVVVPPETKPETELAESIRDAIEERKAFCAGAIPAIYLDTWARLNHQKPMRVSEAEWYRTVDDGGRFFDAWGSDAADWGWTAGDLFDVPRDGQRGGLFWFIAGAAVEAFGPDHARLSDGRIFDRGTIGGEWARMPRGGLKKGRT